MPDSTALLLDASRQVLYDGAPDRRGLWYALWVDEAGSAEIRTASGVTVPPGVIYVGRCVDQSLSKHLVHRDIGQLTVLKSLAALFRTSWGLTGTGQRLDEPGRTRLLDWVRAHLQVTWAEIDPGETASPLGEINAPLRIHGGHLDPTPLRRLLRAERARIDM
jgi:hypothetical protein